MAINEMSKASAKAYQAKISWVQINENNGENEAAAEMSK